MLYTSTGRRQKTGPAQSLLSSSTTSKFNHLPDLHSEEALRTEREQHCNTRCMQSSGCPISHYSYQTTWTQWTSRGCESLPSKSKFGSKHKSLSLGAESQVSALQQSVIGCFMGEQYGLVLFCWHELQFHLKEMK